MNTSAVRVVLVVTALLVVAACAPGGGAGSALAKMDGWGPDTDPTGNVFATLDIAYDAPSAQRLWDQNVPATLPEGSGDPDAPGIYGDLSDVDFDTHVVGMLSGGQSGSCPAWVTDVELREDNVIALRTNARQYEACTADFNPYRFIMVIDRDDVPPAAEVGDATLLIDDQGWLERHVREFS